MLLGIILIAAASYLLGSIPTGYLLVRIFRHQDIRAVGSGNIGATNAMRVLGKPAGIFVMLMDTMKGFGAIYLGIICAHLSLTIIHFSATESNAAFYEKLFNEFPFSIIAGIFAVLGHNYTCWLKFKGGKGIATMAGVYLALAPEALGIALAVFILVILTTRYVSLGSIVAAIALPVAVWFTNENLILRIVTVALCALAVYKHKSNIQRLMAGTENRLGKKPEVAK
jgi:glycerol-3-phosphate acyltransferase PlsY